MREFLLSHQDLARKLTELERRVEELAFDHSKQTRSTRVQLQQAFEAIRELMALPPEPRRRPIGFVVPEDNPSGKARATQLPRRKVEDRPASTVRTRWMKKPPSTKN